MVLWLAYHGSWQPRVRVFKAAHHSSCLAFALQEQALQAERKQRPHVGCCQQDSSSTVSWSLVRPHIWAQKCATRCLLPAVRFNCHVAFLRYLGRLPQHIIDALAFSEALTCHCDSLTDARTMLLQVVVMDSHSAWTASIPGWPTATVHHLHTGCQGQAHQTRWVKGTFLQAHAAQSSTVAGYTTQSRKEGQQQLCVGQSGPAGMGMVARHHLCE
jgi:hypothetical protein